MSRLKITTALSSFGGAAAREPGNRPILLLMHGYGSHEDDLTSLLPALGSHFDWASLRAPLVLREQTPAEVGSYAWVPIDRPGLPDPEQASAATDAVLAWLDEHTPPAANVIPIGFSQGGLMVTQLLRRDPQRFERLTDPHRIVTIDVGVFREGDVVVNRDIELLLQAEPQHGLVLAGDRLVV